MGAKSVLFICGGNTCRSPMAAALLRDYLAQRARKWPAEVNSAGLHANLGSSLSSNARATLRANGISADDHCGKSLSQKMLDDCGLAICMTQFQRCELKNRFRLAKSIHLLGHFCEPRSENIADPFGQNLAIYSQIFEQIRSALPAILRTMESPFDDEFN